MDMHIVVAGRRRSKYLRKADIAQLAAARALRKASDLLSRNTADSFDAPALSAEVRSQIALARFQIGQMDVLHKKSRREWMRRIMSGGKRKKSKASSPAKKAA